MRGEFGFNLNERSFGDVHPSQPIGENLGFEKTPVNNEPPEHNTFESFDSVAENFSKVGKIIDRKEQSESSILLQQNIAKSILSAENSAAVKKIWEEYQRLVDDYAKELTTDKDKAEARSYFNSLKRSILGSVATVNFFEEQGFKVKFPTAKEDGYKKCDLMFESEKKKDKKFILAAQIKSHHLPAIGKKEVARVIDRLVLTDGKELSGKDQNDFNILERYCGVLSKEAGMSYFPIFMNIPVSREIGEGRRVDVINLVDSNGKINEVLQKSLDVKWREKRKALGIDKK